MFTLMIYFQRHLGGSPDLMRDGFLTRNDAIQYAQMELRKHRSTGRIMPVRVLVAEHIEELESI